MSSVPAGAGVRKAQGWVIRFGNIDGEWAVDIIRLSVTGGHLDGGRFRVIATVPRGPGQDHDELRQHVDPAELEGAVSPGGWPSRLTPSHI
jgi:hypothetical protein